jgi:hypothetical protein
MPKIGEGAKGADDKCPFCKGKLTDSNHAKKIPEGGTNKRDGNFANLVLGGDSTKILKGHSLYEEGSTPQAHHLISVSAIKNFGKQCRAIGYNINCKENCVFLPSSREKACQYAIQYHQGGHLPLYFTTVKSLVKDIFDGFKENKCTDYEQKIQDVVNNLHAKSQEILKKIQRFNLLLQTDSLNYLPGNILGCTLLARSGKYQEKTDDKPLKTTIKEIEKKRKFGKEKFSSFMDSKFLNSDTNVDEQLKNIKEKKKISCKCGRNHNLFPPAYTINVGNIITNK